MWRQTTRKEENRRIWAEELDSFVPKKVLDFHVHIFGKGVVPEGDFFPCAGHPIKKYGLDDLAQDLADLYPGHETLAVCFGLPDVAYHQQCNDQYVAKNCDR